jgi:UDP-N-acetylmuramyl pentapeptide phosphotransferase/UDP-N-acetylglucosamine-1-phosphate transferase
VEYSFSVLEIFRFDAFIAAVVSFFVALLLVLTKHLHGSLSMDSHAGMQKFHVSPTPRIGGIAIAIGVLVGFSISSQEAAANSKRLILSTIILAGIPAFLFGLLEDLTKKVSVKARLLATICSGLLGWGITGVAIRSIDIPGIDLLLNWTVVAVIFTAFCAGGIANAINIIDGFHGLAAGSVLIMLAGLGVIAREVGDIPLAFSSLVIAGAIAGFFFVNWPFGKIFLGDGGAYFIGFALAWIAILLPYRNPSISPWASLTICIYPILEVSFSFVRKTLRTGYHPGRPDRVHLHMLIHKRLVARVTRWLNLSLTADYRNAATSLFCWLLALLPVMLAHRYAQNTRACVLIICMMILVYALIYFRLSRFKWFKF